MRKVVFIFFFISILSSCYYDNEQELYSKIKNSSGSCDTSNVLFSADIYPAIQSNCLACHGGNGAAGGNISLQDYNGIKAVVNSGRLIGAINHHPGFSAMPKGGAKMNDCTLKKFDSWVGKGSLNN